MLNPKNKKIGLRWILIPAFSLIGILVIWGISSFIVNRIAPDININAEAIPSPAEIIGRIINVALGFLGIINVIFVFVGLIVGFSYLKKEDAPINVVYDERSGKGDKSEFPKELNKWNWGAAGLTWIWGAYHSVWMSFLSWIPILNLFFWIILGLNGNKWAWQKTKWESVEKFQLAQNKWKPWGILFFILTIILTILSLLSRGE